MLYPERIETDRLVLERFGPDTVDPFVYYETFGADPAAAEIYEYVPGEPFATVKEAHDRLLEQEEAFEEGEKAMYAVRPREGEPRAGEFAGTAELHTHWERRTGRLGLLLAKPFWGRGYSGERAAALIELAFDRLDLELVATGYNEGNERSKRAIETYVEAHGGQYDGVLRNWVPMDDGVDDLHRYTISRAQYEATVGGEEP